MNVTLWVAAGMLAVVALMGGLIKLVVPKAKLAKQPGARWVGDASGGFGTSVGMRRSLCGRAFFQPSAWFILKMVAL